MAEKDKNILKYNHGEKSVKAPIIIYASTESLLEKIEHVTVILKIHQQLK